MSAPALVLLAPGCTSMKAEQMFHRLRHEMQIARPTLSIGLAFTHTGSPTIHQVVRTLAGRETREIVFVPVDFTHVSEPEEHTSRQIDAAQLAYPDIKMTTANPIGPAVELFSILNVRLRNALSYVHATELDGLVLSLPDWGDTRGNRLIARRARQWSTHHKLPVQVARDDQGPSVSAAISSLREMGRRAVAVGSLHMVPDDEYLRQAEAALAAGAVAVSAPLGVTPQLLDLAMARYAYAAMSLIEPVAAADSEDQLAVK